MLKKHLFSVSHTHFRLNTQILALRYTPKLSELCTGICNINLRISGIFPGFNTLMFPDVASALETCQFDSASAYFTVNCNFRLLWNSKKKKKKGQQQLFYYYYFIKFICSDMES